MVVRFGPGYLDADAYRVIYPQQAGLQPAPCAPPLVGLSWTPLASVLELVSGSHLVAGT